MQKVCNNTILITKKHVKSYQNKLFFVPSSGVKLTKNRNVLFLRGAEASPDPSRRYPLEDRIVGISPVVLALLYPRKPLLVFHVHNHVAFPC